MSQPRPHLSDGVLYVEGAPFTVLGGEVHNSSSSSPEAIRRSFALTRAMGANTVLAPIAWERVEPVEGEFDFSLVDEMIRTARESRLKLIPLWFGSWKNGMSSYVPEWVKTDTARFPRARVCRRQPDGSQQVRSVEVLSPFSAEAAECDARAFAAVMRRFAEIDHDSTVIMVQVENEVGLLGDSRDRGRLAEDAWNDPVPAVVVQALPRATRLAVQQEWTARGSQAEGSWSELLGDSPTAEEAFMAWGYARFVEHVAQAGRAELDVPLLVNAWQDAEIDLDLPDDVDVPQTAVAGGQQPGMYPSGGPVIRVAEIWRATATTIDLLTPDIYFGDFDEISRDYALLGGGLLIPEMRRAADGVAGMFVAFGDHAAIGVSPFGIDSIDITSDEAATLKDGYRLLRAVSPATTPAASRAGIMIDQKTPVAERRIGDYRVEATAARPFGFARPVYPAYGALILEAPDTFLIAGRGLTLTFNHADGLGIGILSVAELNDAGEVVRWRNGDETGSGSAIRMAELSPAPSDFPIPTWDECSGLLRVRLYRHD